MACRPPGVRVISRGTVTLGRVLVDIVVYDGLDELDALGPLEVLRSAGQAGADLTVRLVTRERQDVVVGAYGLRFLPDAVYQPGADVLIVSGGGWVARAEIGAWGEVQRGPVASPVAFGASDRRPVGRGVHRDDAARPRRRDRASASLHPPRRLG